MKNTLKPGLESDFTFRVTDGKGTHERFVIDKKRFDEKINKKKGI